METVSYSKIHYLKRLDEKSILVGCLRATRKKGRVSAATEEKQKIVRKASLKGKVQFYSLSWKKEVFPRGSHPTSSSRKGLQEKEEDLPRKKEKR